MNNLFLEGKKGSGKSTAIQEILLCSRKKVAGFYVVRKITGEDQILGFELQEASSIEGVVTSRSPLKADRCFLWKHEGRMVYQESVFRNRGCCLLRQALKQTDSLVLLDEIGGVELIERDFFELLLSLLQSQQKVLGVFKSEENFSTQRLFNVDKKEIMQRREIIKAIIDQPQADSYLLQWKENYKEQIQKKIAAFID